MLTPLQLQKQSVFVGLDEEILIPYPPGFSHFRHAYTYYFSYQQIVFTEREDLAAVAPEKHPHLRARPGKVV